MNDDVNNPLSIPVVGLFKQLNLLNGLLRRLEDTLRNFKNSYRQFYAEQGIETSRVIASHMLVIQDLSALPDQKRITVYPTGRFSVHGSQYVRVADRLLGRECLWTISLAFEAFETFLNDTCAYVVHSNRNLATATKVAKFVENYKGALVESDIGYWKEYIRYTYQRKNRKLLAYLRNIEARIATIERFNPRRINLCNWFRVVTMVRHGVTHANFNVKPDQLMKLSTEDKRLLRRHFRGSRSSNGYELEGNIKDSHRALVIFAEYAFVLFRCLSERLSYEWQILPDAW